MKNAAMHLNSAQPLPSAATRDGLGEGLLIAGKEKKVVVLCADLAESTRTVAFKKKFPDRFIEVGVAEQNLVTIASGMASMGKIPFAASFAAFSPGRNWEQIRTTICYNNVAVKIAGCHAGLSVGPDGATHQALEDVALMRILPNMTVIVPCDAIEAAKATIAAAQHPSPVYLRFGREKTPTITTQETPFSIGKANIIIESNNPSCALIANGILVSEALLAAETLKKEYGIETLVINCHTVKPLDEKTILDAARRCGKIVTAEEHQKAGGLGSAIAEFLAQSDVPTPMRLVAVDDSFGESGTAEELLKKYHLTAKDIVAKVQELVSSHEPPSEGAVEGERITRREGTALILSNGTTVRTIPELHYALMSMSDGDFSKHMEKGSNDFAEWIRAEFEDHSLANALEKCTTKEHVAAVLAFRK